MREEVKEILEHCIEYATDIIVGTDQIYPFGAFTDRMGVHPLEFDVDLKNVEPNGRIVESLSNYCKEEIKAGNMTAWGMTYEVSLTLDAEKGPEDALAIDIVCDGEDIPMYYLPIVLGDKARVGKVFAVKRY